MGACSESTEMDSCFHDVYTRLWAFHSRGECQGLEQELFNSPRHLFGGAGNSQHRSCLTYSDCDSNMVKMYSE